MAVVEVDVDLDSNKTAISERYGGDGWIAHGHLEDVTEKGYDDWKAGAKKGIEWALEVAKTSKHVQIIRITGMITDTDPGIVQCAAAHAVWNALGFVPDDSTLAQIEKVLANSWQKYRDGQNH